MTIVRICPICKNVYFLALDKSASAGYEEYRTSGRLIQDCMAGSAPAEREFAKTGYCAKCQSVLFGTEPSLSIKPVSELVDD